MSPRFMRQGDSNVSLRSPFKNFDLENRSRSLRHGGVSLLSTKAQVPEILSPNKMISLGARNVQINDAHTILHNYYTSKNCDKYVRQTHGAGTNRLLSKRPTLAVDESKRSMSKDMSL